MKSLDKLFKLADRIENKLKRYAGVEVEDSGVLSSYIKPVVESVIDTKVAGLLKNIVPTLTKSGLSGDVVIGDDFTFSATKAGGKWSITSMKVGSNLGGFSGDAGVQSAVAKLLGSVNAMITPLLVQKLNTINLGNADTITNHGISGLHTQSIGI